MLFIFIPPLAEHEVRDFYANVDMSGGMPFTVREANVRTIDSIGPNEIIHCPTLKDAQRFCELLCEHGRRWSDGKLSSNENHWRIYKEKTCYRVNFLDISYGTYEFFLKLGDCEIISCKEFVSCDTVHHDKPVYQWEWRGIDKPGIWVSGGSELKPLFSCIMYFEKETIGGKSWRAYLGPVPEIAAPQFTYVELKLDNIDFNNFPDKVFTKENDEYIEKTLLYITIERCKNVEFVFGDLTIKNTVYVKN